MISNLTFAKRNISSLNLFEEITLSESCLIAAFALILVTGVFGNAFVIFIFGNKKSNHRSTTDSLILYLGIVDFLTSFFNPLLYIYWTITKYQRWDFGNLGCQIIPSIGPIMTSVSSGLLLILAIDRYIAIVTPFYGQLTPKTVTIAFILDIFLSILSFLHYILALRIHPTYNYCYIPNMADYKYGLPNCSFIILRLSIFSIVFGFTNIKIFRTLKKCSVNIKSKEVRVERLKQSKKITVVLLTMGLVFILLVFPRELFYLVIHITLIDGKKNAAKFSNTLMVINSWLKVAHTANSCANVFIYSHMQTKYRKQIIRILASFGCCKKTFSRQSISVSILSYIRDRGRFSSRNYRQEFKKILLTQEEDSISSADAVFFQRAQQWKVKV
ncbi:C-X-C chemokine receptor type 1 [Hydra vulgaris]|uniref:C-X-C chemokine receptor type 1 n=1 Tax=Hydra vulgaris TaxID=6087 RepID=UPI000640F72E|nr:C-X-C chemokine receptor type 1-like [Hydra vulgaris]XP_047130917.1 C-X-C chemokine receptor type 1-like [Hydra vulgaris]XP_047130918.1 C-X-C chemokine receptor type 1-like [Hydra vulgaris]